MHLCAVIPRSLSVCLCWLLILSTCLLACLLVHLFLLCTVSCFRPTTHPDLGHTPRWVGLDTPSLQWVLCRGLRWWPCRHQNTFGHIRPCEQGLPDRGGLEHPWWQGNNTGTPDFHPWCGGSHHIDSCISHHISLQSHAGKSGAHSPHHSLPHRPLTV